LYLSF